MITRVPVMMIRAPAMTTPAMMIRVLGNGTGWVNLFDISNTMYHNIYGQNSKQVEYHEKGCKQYIYIYIYIFIFQKVIKRKHKEIESMGVDKKKEIESM
ncbi:hypothetical protein YC2023_105971 [Brassica napus]